MEQTLKSPFTSNYWRLCQNKCSWNILVEIFAAETFKNISAVGVQG